MITLDRVSCRFGNTLAVDDVSLEVERGTIAALVGTSGSGKSTTLRLINRLIEATAGTIRVDGRDVLSVSGVELRRGIGYVIQGYGLFPHWTVARNIATVPTLLHWERSRIDARVRELLALFDLNHKLYADKFPHELSGGQQQRVGVARALAAEPGVLLMDEPFGALDPIIRGKAQEDLLALQRRLGITILMVTHDLDEAIRLADRIAVMDAGRIMQVASPADLLARPQAGYVERLVGNTERPYRLLALASVADALEPGTAEGTPLPASASLREALAELLWRKTDRLPVLQDGQVAGSVSLAGILRRVGRQP